MTKHFIAETPDGTLVHRSSQSREYTHAVIVKDSSGKWGAYSWASRHDLTAARMKEAINRGYKEANVVEASGVAAKDITHKGGFAEMKDLSPKKVEEPKPEIEPIKDLNPTKSMYDTLYSAYDFFHGQLFDMELTPVVLLVHRKRNAHGYFWDQQWETKDGDTKMPEIALNPQTMGRSITEVLSTLVHEMAHQWDALYGKVPQHGHGKTWAAKMEEVGLMPSTTGKPGGKKTGRHVTHYVIEEGPFAEACAKFLEQGHDFSWFSPAKATIKKRDRSKVKHTCPCCGTNIWGKENLNVRCGDCDEPMVEMDV